MILHVESIFYFNDISQMKRLSTGTRHDWLSVGVVVCKLCEYFNHGNFCLTQVLLNFRVLIQINQFMGLRSKQRNCHSLSEELCKFGLHFFFRSHCTDLFELRRRFFKLILNYNLLFDYKWVLFMIKNIQDSYKYWSLTMNVK